MILKVYCFDLCWGLFLQLKFWSSCELLSNNSPFRKCGPCNYYYSRKSLRSSQLVVNPPGILSYLWRWNWSNLKVIILLPFVSPSTSISLRTDVFGLFLCSLVHLLCWRKRQKYFQRVIGLLDNLINRSNLSRVSLLSFPSVFLADPTTL